MPMEVHIMFPTPTERSALVLAEGGAGAVLSAGPATATELEMTGLLIATFVPLLIASGGEVLAVLGLLIWTTALLVPLTFDVSRLVRRLRSRRASWKGATRREMSR
ncbi:hypothetical protein [Nocardioides pyridinolyticus]